MPASDSRARLFQAIVSLFAAGAIVGALSAGTARAATASEAAHTSTPTTISNLSCSAPWDIGLTSAAFDDVPATIQQVGVEVTAPFTGSLTSFTAAINSDANQAVTVDVYQASDSAPAATLLSSFVATIPATSSSLPQSFTLDQPVTGGTPYFVALIPSAATADSNWAVTNDSSSACNPGATYEAPGGGTWQAFEAPVVFSATFDPQTPTHLPNGAIRVTICRRAHHGPHPGRVCSTTRIAFPASLMTAQRVSAHLLGPHVARRGAAVKGGRVRVHTWRVLPAGQYTLVVSGEKSGHRLTVRRRLSLR